MRLSARLGFMLSIAVMALTAACSDSSAPNSVDQASVVAARFDSIYLDAFARSDSGRNAFETRALLASLIEIPAALGAVPSSITVSTATGTEHWNGYEFLELTPPADSTDSAFVLLAFRESNAHTVLIAFFDSTGTLVNAGVITEDTISAMPGSGGGSTSLGSVAATCGSPSASLLNPQFDSPLSSSCSLASFRTSTTLTFPSLSPVDPALASITISSASVNGIRIVDPADDASTRRVRSLLSASRFARRR